MPRWDGDALANEASVARRDRQQSAHMRRAGARRAAIAKDDAALIGIRSAPALGAGQLAVLVGIAFAHA